MRIYNRSTLLQFGRKHLDAEVAVADWGNPADVKQRYPHASLIGGKRVVFNVGGNKYRLIAEIDYTHHVVFIHFIGTHNQYDRVDAETVVWNPKS